MDRIDAMRIFARVVERRSFIQAAHDLAVPRSRVSEAVQKLERHLGARLLTRTTRQVMPTPEGAEYHASCVSILSQIDAAEGAATNSVPHGPLRIGAHGTFARHFLMPHLAGFLDHHPGITLHINDGDALVDLVRDGVDCVIRVGKPADSSLVGKKLGLLEEGTFASPSYLARHGTPVSPDNLAGHVMVGFVSSRTKMVMPLKFRTSAGVSSVDVPARMTVASADAMARLAIHGHGLIQVPRYRVATELRKGTLVEVLASCAPTPMPVWILHPAGGHVSPRARVFIDWVTPIISHGLNCE